MANDVLAANIRALRSSLDLKQAAFAERVRGQQPDVSKWERGTEPNGRVLSAMAAIAGCSVEQFMDRPWTPPVRQQDRPPTRSADTGEVVEMVGIRHSDTTFGLGATFTDEASEIEVLQFPKPWVESITYTSPALLSWVRARGSSMAPTINDGDMILLDHSERRVRDQDELWAYTIGDTRGIKRLRVKGDRFQILSDNPAVPLDEEPIDFVNIVARVVFVGRRT